MKYNQYSYIGTSVSQAEKELKELGFQISSQKTNKANLATFVSQVYFHNPDKDDVFKSIIADSQTDLATFLHSDRELTEGIFYTLALQLLEFTPHIAWDLEILEIRVAENYDLVALKNYLEEKRQDVYLDKKEKILVFSDPSQIEIWLRKVK